MEACNVSFSIIEVIAAYIAGAGATWLGIFGGALFSYPLTIWNPCDKDESIISLIKCFIAVVIVLIPYAFCFIVIAIMPLFYASPLNCSIIMRAMWVAGIFTTLGILTYKIKKDEVI